MTTFLYWKSVFIWITSFIDTNPCSSSIPYKKKQIYVALIFYADWCSCPIHHMIWYLLDTPLTLIWNIRKNFYYVMEQYFYVGFWHISVILTRKMTYSIEKWKTYNIRKYLIIAECTSMNMYSYTLLQFNIHAKIWNVLSSIQYCISVKNYNFLFLYMSCPTFQELRNFVLA